MIQVNPFCKRYMSPVSVSKTSCVICAKFKASLLFVISIGLLLYLSSFIDIIPFGHHHV